MRYLGILINSFIRSNVPPNNETNVNNKVLPYNILPSLGRIPSVHIFHFTYNIHNCWKHDDNDEWLVNSILVVRIQLISKVLEALQLKLVRRYFQNHNHKYHLDNIGAIRTNRFIITIVSNPSWSTVIYIIEFGSKCKYVLVANLFHSLSFLQINFVFSMLTISS